MTRRILLSTIHSSDNYGSVLQATCLAEALVQYGEIDVLDYRPTRTNVGYAQDWFPYQVLRRRVNPQFVAFIGKHRKMRRAQRRLPLTRRVWRPGPSDFDGYDTAVVGSDEVWSSLWGNVPAYFLADAPDSVRRVAYATSVGRSPAIGRSAKVPEWLSRFDVVLPRDAKTAELCRNSGVVPREVVCDPVMLTEPDELLAMARPAAGISGSYTLVYSEGCRHDERVGRIVNALGAPRALQSIGFPYPGARSLIGAGLPEFIATIAGADLVITSMFHGVVTGLSLGKTVAVLQHPAKAMKVADLIERVAAEQIIEGSGFLVVSPSPQLDRFRESSRAALKAALA